MQGIAKREIKVMLSDNNLIPFSVGVVTFVLSFFLLTRREVEYIEELSFGVAEISKGNLNYRVKQKTRDELGLLATRINFMSEELKLRIQEEKKAEKTKNELITNMSHDLRTPLTSIMGYLRMLKDKKYEDTDQLEEYIDIAYTKSERLKALIDDLFIYSKLANEETILYKQKLCLNDMLVQLAEELSPVADERNMVFVKEIQHERVIVNVDADKLVRVFENLLSNAIKYGYSPGEIIISMVSGRETVSVRVSNKGDIIPQEELPFLFDRLYMVDKSRSSSESGSGLGLAISKSILNLHNGKIWAECEQNNISFCVELPRVHNDYGI
jgi:signal transduction histidine kinase